MSSQTEYNYIVGSADWRCAHCARPWAEHTDKSCNGFTRVHRDFVAMLRIKNEARWIAEVIESILPLCDRVYVFDDHSTDETVNICRRYSAVTVFPSPFTGLNESRDKNWLLDQIMIDCEPQWILCIDGDEILEKRGPEIIWNTCTADPDCMSYSVQIAFMWDSPDLVRVDRIYGDFWRPSLFRPFVERPGHPDDRRIAEEFRFRTTPWGRQRNGDSPNLHCSSVPQRRIHGRKLCPVRLKHYGYLNRDDRVRKLDYYTSIDWKNQAEDCYRHMCQGDAPQLEELPRVQQLAAEGYLSADDIGYITNVSADASFVHAGPLRVVRWDEDVAWPVSEWARMVHGQAA